MAGRQAWLLRNRVRHYHLNHSKPCSGHHQQEYKNMKELAKQELKLLEAQHPTRFQYLKLQLKEFIHILEQEEEEKQQQFYQSMVTDQESSSSRKRQREGEKDDGCKMRRGEGVRDAIHRAEACLHKIQTLKSFFCSSNH
ncbi:hypothetical protein L1987_71311 [Smallanthus sonchifolius]|uniref:Uncharacterized protein n=1 Tax=Smallanthus sonchifolius TaxID=185202 RepID=A0ACB9AS13_9ASTR|nr:hypothetical protein L1987_71311 [Smallanthus sonchifolius]